MDAASVIVVTHNSADLVGPVLDALQADPDGPGEVIVVDNASTDDTLATVERPGVRVIPLSDNVGFAAGCHVGAAAANESVLVFLGHDTVPRPGWLEPLAAAAMEPGTGAAMATIEDANRPGRFNTSGGHLTYYGLAWVSDLGKPIPTNESGRHPVPFPSGAAMAMTRDRWEQFGGFRESLFMYHEDTDLGWRLRLAGLDVVREPQSRVLHHYDFERAPAKLFWLERNRRILLNTNYRLPTRLILSPAFATADAGIWLIARRDGWAAERRRARRSFQAETDARHQGRRLVEENRRFGDSVVLRTMDSSISGIPQIAPPRGSRIVDRLLGAYQRLAVPVVSLFDRLSGLETRHRQTE